MGFFLPGPGEGEGGKILFFFSSNGFSIGEVERQYGGCAFYA